MSISLTPRGAAPGAEIGGVRLRSISNGAFAAIYRARLDYSVLLLCEQVFTELIARSAGRSASGLCANPGSRDLPDTSSQRIMHRTQMKGEAWQTA